jgi:hypothetical protein
MENSIKDMNSMISASIEERKRLEKEEKQPLILCFGGSFTHEVQIPIVKKITPYIVDLIDPIISSKTNKRRDMLEQIEKTGIPGLLALDTFKKDVHGHCKDCSETCTECSYEQKASDEHNRYVGSECIKFYAQSKLPKNLIYSKAEFNMLLSDSIDKPQQKEDYRITLEILKVIVRPNNANKVNKYPKAALDSWNIEENLNSDYDSEFWQNQDIEEVTRVVNHFRKRAKR